MGQAFSLATPTAGSAGIDVPEMIDFTYEKSMGNAQFMKSIRARHEDGVVLVKALVKPYTPMSLDKYSGEIIRQRKALADIPNVLAFQRVIETETNGYLVRPFLHSSLYDRMSTRPFLEDIEKKWMAFQLLCALRDCHARDIYHGDIKAQNVLVTSWNWVYLTDFSSPYKPTMLPDDNPADFSYFFDTSGKRTCYVAPERFLPAGAPQQDDTKLTWAMDVFSAGCLIAQLFLETELFTLSQLYKYRRGEYDPAITALSVIADEEVRDMIAHMIQLDPGRRYTADQYLEFFRGKVFPEYFYSFLHEYMHMMTDVSPSAVSPNQTTANAATQKHLGEPDERIDHVFNDLDKIMYFLNTSASHSSDRGPEVSPQRRSPRLGLDQFPVHLNVANHDHVVSMDIRNFYDDGTLIFLDLVTSSMRNTTRSASRIRACDILLAFAERLTDEARLDRVLPYLVSLLTDDSDMVVIASLRSITQLVQMVKTITPINSHVFVEYLIPRIHAALKGVPNKRPPASRIVRATYASCIGALAITASRFLEMAATLQAKRTSGNAGFSGTDPEVESGNEDEEAAFDELFDNAQRQLYGLFEVHTKILIEDPDVYVRRAFLTSAPALCLFFGPVESNDILLTHLNTYLNDRDWMLKCAFFDTVVGISTLVGVTALEQFILPLLMQALADPEEFVIQSAIHALAQLASLGLLSRPKIWELIDIISRCTMHPNLWIRQTSAEFIAAACKYLSFADVRCILAPMLQPYMKVYTAPRLTEIDLLDLLKKPLSRQVYDHAVLWASNAEGSRFWKPFQRLRSFSFNALGAQAKSINTPKALAKVPRDDEDDQWVSKLKNLGMAAEDEFKLLALREFIWRFARTKARASASASAAATGLSSTVSGPLAGISKNSSLILLGSLGITPQTVFFDEAPKEEEDSGTTNLMTNGPTPMSKTTYTISDALMDASMTIDEVAKRKKSGSGPSRSASHTRMVSRDESAGPFTRSLRPHTRDNSDAASLISNRRSLKVKPSALTLLDRRDGNKTAAETGTSDTTVFGEVEGPFAPLLSNSKSGDSAALGSGPQAQASSATDAAIKVQHSYEGNDPNILKMLDTLFLQNYPYDMTDFGPFVPPIGQRRGILVAGAPGTRWRPGSRLVAMFAEHTAAINRVAVSPDHRFFVTASDDGTAKVWDTQRLERNISQRSRQTYHHAPGARIVSLCFVDGSSCFVTCASDGSVHVVRVDVTLAKADVTAATNTAAANSSASVRYGRPRQLRRYQLPSGEFAVWCDHFKQENSSVLVLATNRSRIVALDLRLMKELYVLENPVHHGMPTCFCIDRKRNWIVVGTSHGVIDLWDLRFRMRLKAWGVPGKSPIYRIGHHPTKGHGKWICVAGGTGLGEVTVWDVEKTLCREIYRIASTAPSLGSGSGSSSTGGGTSSTKEGPKGYTAWDVDQDRPEGMLGRFATSIEPPAPTDRGVRAMLVGTGVSQDGLDVKHAFLITGGSDKKLRFWDLALLDNSLVYAGLGPDEAPPRFVASSPAPGVLINTERVPREGRGGRGERDETQHGRYRAATAATSANRPARNTVISQEQQHLLRSHLDCITDVALLEHPYTMSVSVDRSGVIYVFQ
ncbi:Serine/threonine-protein kinase VPS15 [Ceratocystis platani]|uniref:non-specific serine/threonine protein kinase n=1 Tax=Ceratocystis fimbriata f. sp. platani TaxID=88771 RepID=A0A0F8DII3_CERFI|nr:Serine/threonine-protein kinase VPS15 [Ceratocystis platani]